MRIKAALPQWRNNKQVAGLARSRFVGCMIGGAIGDAMGMPAEGFSRHQIIKRFGEITHLLPHITKKGTKPAGSWTDDTFTSMMTAKSILEVGRVDVDHLIPTYIDGLNYGFGIAGTTRRALELRSQGYDISSLKNGRHAGAGATVRSAPIALFHANDLEALKADVQAVSEITHQDRDAVAAAVMVGFTIAWAVRGELDPKVLIHKLKALSQDLGSNLHYNLSLTEELLASGVRSEECMDEIGRGGSVMQVIPSAYYAFLAHPKDFLKTIQVAVNAGGDADTRAAIAGYISGAYNGIEQIPSNLVKKLENFQLIADYAERLFFYAA
ncbi:ADP-ribosylglycohydrolase family protein [Candidatus Margulisiibacteriota bacterium]